MTDDQILAEGRQRLQELLPRAREAMATMQAKPGSGLGEAIRPFVTEDNLEAVLVYPAPKGGWHADVMLRKVPLGVTNVIGTPVERPMPTRAAAEQAALDLLALMLVVVENNKSGTDAPAPPVFLLHDFSIPLVPPLLQKMVVLAEAHGVAPGYGSVEEAGRRLAEMLAQLMPEGVSPAALGRLNAADGSLSRFMGVIHLAVLSGVFAYPLRQDAPPPAMH